MLLTNFRLLITSLIELDAYGVIWNLHNNAEFCHIVYTIESQTTKLSWRFFPPLGPDEPIFPADRFDIVFYKTYYLEVSPRDPSMPSEEDRLLDTVSYIAATSNTREYMHNFLIPCFDPAIDRGEYHMIFRLRGGQMVRIGAENAEFVLVNENSDTVT